MQNDDFQLFAARVESFEIDPGEKVLTFVERLARENRWNVDYAERVVREYKRFCMLAMRSGHYVTPSEAVDQAWHLHLTYTRSYWDRFCGQTLGRPLHHEPTQGGVNEGAKFTDWYARTLESYQQLFGDSPPKDIWPAPKERFAHAGEWKWINVGHYWLIPRGILWPAVAALLLIALAAIVPGCASALGGNPPVAELPVINAQTMFPFSLGGSEFLLFYLLLCGLGVAVILGLRMAAETSAVAGSNGDVELSPDELAVLAGGGSRLANISVARLFTEGRIDVKPGRWFSSGKFIAKPGMAPAQPAVDCDLYAAIAQGTETSQLLKVVKPHFERINDKLVRMQLRHERAYHSGLAWFIMLAVGLLGLARLLQGLWLGEEIGGLLAMLVVFVVVTILSNARSSRVTPAGRAYLTRVKSTLNQRHVAPLAFGGADGSRAGIGNELLLMNVALLGVVAMSDVEGFSSVASVMGSMGGQQSAAATGSGCGAGCSSGCGGGGCGGGGCGGCGG